MNLDESDEMLSVFMYGSMFVNGNRKSPRVRISSLFLHDEAHNDLNPRSTKHEDGNQQ